MNTTAKNILHFWFGESGSSKSDYNQDAIKRWFMKDEKFDRLIETNYSKTIDDALQNKLDWRLENIHEKLALVIVLDQFTRNIFRGQAKTYAGDPKALRLVKNSIAEKEDQKLSHIERSVFYMPLEHSENLIDQELCMKKFQELVNECCESQKKLYEDYHHWAVKHWEIIKKFGRFPHRNKILGRESTKEEIEFLKQPGSSF